MKTFSCERRRGLMTECFAKEAMSNQTLDHGEVLMIRWAFDDPNPVAQDSITRADKDAIASLLQSKGISLEQAPFQYPEEYQMPSKKLKSGGTAVDVDEFLATHPDLAYPDTNIQYSGSENVRTNNLGPNNDDDNQNLVDLDLDNLESRCKSDHDDTKKPAESHGKMVSTNEWIEHVDPDSGATYYYNESTGESTWGIPER